MIKSKLAAGVAALAVIGLLVSVTVVSQEHEKTREKTTKLQPVEGGPDMEMMAKWMAFSTPGPQHEWFKKLAGKWDAETKIWMGGPDSEPTVSMSESEMKLIFGGRYLVSTFKGQWMGMPFEGMAIDGYDNLRKEYTSVWIDNMGSGIMTLTGQPDAGGKVVRYESIMSDPGTGEKYQKGRSVVRFESDDRLVMEMYDKVGTKAEFKMMEITYTRKK